MLNVVIDTVVFVRSLINPHSWWGKIIFSSSSSYRLFLSPPLFEEIIEVLNRPELKKKFKSLQAMDMKTVLDILSHAKIVEIDSVPAISRDSKDDKFLATAYAAKADYLITEDEDLLVLKEYQGIQIITTEQFFTILKSENVQLP